MGFGSMGPEHQTLETQMGSNSATMDLNLQVCHAEDVLQNLNTFRKSRLFTDVVLRIDGQEFHCHRATLSASSTYFRTMFSTDFQESKQDTVDIKGISADTMDCVIDYMYGGRGNIREDNVLSLLEASDLFQVSVLRQGCVEFLEKQLDPCNCLGFLNFANLFAIQALSEKSKRFLLEHFPEVIQHEEFLQLPKEVLCDQLSSDLLAIPKEEMVFEAVMHWVRHELPTRRHALKELLEHVRIPLLDRIYFVEKVETDELILSSKECLPLLQEARRYHIFGNEIVSPRTRPRKFTNVAEVIVMLGGCDRKGHTMLPYTEQYNPGTGEWSPLAKIPDYSKSEYAVCTFKNDIFLSGGNLYSNDVWMYNSQLNLWVRVASLNKGRWRHRMVALQGKLYAVGGFNGFSRMSSVECYDPNSNSWSFTAPLLESVSSAAVVACLGKLYVIGGALTNQLNSNKVQCYDPVKDDWTFAASSPFAQRCINAVTVNNMIYIMGGLMENMYKYNPINNYWTVMDNTPGPLENCGLTVCNGMVYILGGKDNMAEGTDRVFCIDPASDQLTLVSTMPRCASYHGCVTIHQRVRRLVHSLIT
ncbi:kelch-like protein 24 [Chiloscyllium plagiosum]|uniref:kelch-like protein 24 n=1 Tax=Chiloscyllium plagiosum TaxID=36176 RepID=UPI001CB7EE2F|nr:kelch-like protein 24 [Chiloscyllium plagiosum]XP_043548745.1 kelch-like protein 24 [Chiloscyllium plagiosum]XP_043548746.1 kelch-like protein 24 [Chiloscyllium plagiosum]